MPKQTRKRLAHTSEQPPWRTPDHDPMRAYITFIGAILQRAVWDARGEEHGAHATRSLSAQDLVITQAQRFLRDSDTVAWYISLTGADPHAVIPHLRQNAGLAPDDPPLRSSPRRLMEFPPFRARPPCTCTRGIECRVCHQWRRAQQGMLQGGPDAITTPSQTATRA
jgi:hypothetical protein